MFQDAIDAALDRCFDAALAGDDWSESLQDLAVASNAAGAMFIPQVPDRPILELPASLDYHDFLKFYVRNRWYENNHRAKVWGMIKEARNIVITEDDLSTPEDRKRITSYNEYYLANGFYGFACAGFIHDGMVWAVSLQRYRSQGHFLRPDAERLATMIPHFRRMIRIADRVTTKEGEARIEALDRVGLPAVMLNHAGRVTGENARFADLVRSGSDIRLSLGRIVVQDGPSRRDLDDLIEAVTGARGSLRQQSKEFAIIRRAVARPIVVEGYAFPSRYPDISRNTTALLVFRELDRPARSVVGQLVALFGLTAAEARVIQRIGAGHSPEQVAEDFGLSLATIRTQIKSAYAKMGVSRQGEVVALVSGVFH